VQTFEEFVELASSGVSRNVDMFTHDAVSESEAAEDDDFYQSCTNVASIKVFSFGRVQADNAGRHHIKTSERAFNASSYRAMLYFLWRDVSSLWKACIYALSEGSFDPPLFNPSTIIPSFSSQQPVSPSAHEFNFAP
jgi:hypothetical protein